MANHMVYWSTWKGNPLDGANTDRRRNSLELRTTFDQYRRVAPDVGRRLWRITCFIVDRKYRKRGVAKTALKAALEAIKKEQCCGAQENLTCSSPDLAYAVRC